MKQIGPGILLNSEILFSSQSDKGKNIYYNVVSAGHFYCDMDYHLVREKYDSILVLYVVDGTFTFVNDSGEHITAEKGDTVILDCYKPHEYYTENHLESIWIHFVGANSRDFYNELYSDSNIIKSENTKRFLLDIISGIKHSLSETEISLLVYRLILSLLNPMISKGNEMSIHSNNIHVIKEYISSHLNEKITVKYLSNIVHMSPTHFSRVFKAQTGFSPYDYVISTRINKSKELLLTTTLSVSQIAYETGFNSEANFVYCFTNCEGVSPGKFRKLKF